jgi:mgtE-like transporter
MVRPRRALARRAKRLLGYWRSERRTLRQGLVALALSTLAGFVAGLTVAHLSDRLAAHPGLLILIPAAVGMKGTIFGAIGARLGTANASGVLTLDLRPGGVLRRNVDVALSTTFSSALWLALLTRLAADAFGAPSIPLGDLVLVAVAGGLLSSLVVLLITLGLSRLSFRLGWDLDAVSTPMVTALGDMTTIPSLFLATALLGHGAFTTTAAWIAGLAAIAIAVAGYLARDAALRRIAVEMTATIAITPVLDVAAGGLQEARLAELTAVPVLLAMIPPFVSQAGALGGIFSSRISSKLQVGVITARGRPEPPAIVDAGIIVALSFAVFLAIGVVAWALGAVTGLTGMPSAAALVGATLLAGLILTPITIVVGYYLAVVTYRFGLDPDNQGVPIITSVMDLAGVACILLVMTSSGVLSHG